MMIAYDSIEEIELFRIKTLCQGIKLEMLGMKKKGRSCHSLAKEEFHLSGTRQMVLEDLISINQQKVAKRN